MGLARAAPAANPTGALVGGPHPRSAAPILQRGRVRQTPRTSATCPFVSKRWSAHPQRTRWTSRHTRYVCARGLQAAKLALAKRHRASHTIRASGSTSTSTVTNRQGDSLSVTYTSDATLYPFANGGFYTDCSTAVYHVGELYGICGNIAFFDKATGSSASVPSTNTETDVEYDACGTKVGGGTTSGWSGTGGTFNGGLAGGKLERVPAYEPATCLGTWTVSYTWTQTFNDGTSLTATATGTFKIDPGQPIGDRETTGGGNPAETPCQPCAGDPVNTDTGEYFESVTDIAVKGRGPGLDFTRTYDSLAPYAVPSGSIGYGWTSNYGMSVTQSGSEITVTNPNGSQTPFEIDPISGGYVAPPRVLATLGRTGSGGWTYVVRDRTTYTFDSSGRLIAITDLNNNSTTLAYNTSGQLVTATDGAGRMLTFTYSGGYLSQITDSAGRSVQYFQDGAGNLQSVTDIRGQAWHYGYDASHLLQTIQDPLGYVVLTNTYDYRNRVLSQKDGLSQLTTYDYATNGAVNTTTVTDPLGLKTLYNFTSGTLSAVTRAYDTSSAATWTFASDLYTLGSTSVTDPNNHVSTVTLDHRGNVLGTRSQLQRTTSATYDALDDRLTFTDARNATETSTFDTHGNLLTTSVPLTGAKPAQSQLTTYTRGDPNHPDDITAITDPLNRVTTFRYDAVGNLSSVTDPAGEKTSYTYDLAGRPVTTVSPRGNAPGADPSQYTTRYGLDAAGNVLTVTDPSNNALTTIYDADGQEVSSKDPNNNTTLTTYDPVGRPTVTTRPDGSLVKQAFDADGNMISQTDGANNSTTFAYDALNHLTSSTDPLNRTAYYNVDATGLLRSQTDRQGRTTTYTYDGDSEVTDATYTDGTHAVHFGYDADGVKTSMTDGTGTSSYVWDSLGRETQVTNGAGAVTKYGYDIGDEQTSVTYPNGKTITQEYDAASRMHAVTDWLSNKTIFDYDADSNYVKTTFPSASGEVDTYGYTSNNAVGSTTMARGATTLAALTYARDPNDQVIGHTESGLPSASASFGYNPLGQLSTVDGVAYDYSANDAPLAAVGSKTTYDVADEMWASGTARYGYNDSGQRVNSVQNPLRGTGQITYTYDQAGNLTSTTANATTTSYKYDGGGLRVSKTTSGVATPFTWDVTHETPTLLSDGSASYIYGPDNAPLESVSPAGVIAYYHHDNIGSTRMLTNSTGAVTATFSYSAFGRPLGTTGTAKTPFGYAGQYTDAETGLVYMRARYFDPSTDQFITRDPLEVSTRAPYTYAGNSPTNFTDPDGLFPPSIGQIASAAGHAVVQGASAAAGAAADAVGAATGVSKEITDVAADTPGFLYKHAGTIATVAGAAALAPETPELFAGVAIVSGVASGWREIKQKHYVAGVLALSAAGGDLVAAYQVAGEVRALRATASQSWNKPWYRDWAKVQEDTVVKWSQRYAATSYIASQVAGNIASPSPAAQYVICLLNL